MRGFLRVALAVCLLAGGGAWAAGEQEALKLGEVVVTATRTPHLLKDVPAETVVITRPDIERSVAQTVQDLLRDVPGILVRAENSPGVSGWRAMMRGMGFNEGYGLILVDGQRILRGGGMGEYGFSLNEIPPELVERIEVVKGPGSALWGSDAMAGVVNIITRPAPPRPSFGLEGGFGTWNASRFSLHGGTTHGPWGVFLSYAREGSDRGKYGRRKRSYDRHSVLNKLSFRPFEDLCLGLDWNWQDIHRKYARERRVRYAPRLEYAFDNGSRLLLRGQWADYELRHYSPGYTARRGDMYYYQGEFQYRIPLGRHLVTVGGEFLEDRLDYNLATKAIKTFSGYLQEELGFRLWRPIRLSVGVRVDDHSEFGTEACPRLAALVELAEGTRLRAQVGRAFKSPTVRQMYYKTMFLHHDYWWKSNPDLDPEISVGWSVGLEQALGAHLVSVTWFRNDFTDKVERVETDQIVDGLPVKTYENVKDAHTQGLELSWRGVILPGLRGSASYTFLDSEDEDTGKDLTYCPQNTATVRLCYDHPRFRVGLGCQYVDKMFTNLANTKGPDAYFLMDSQIAFKIGRCAELCLEGYNLLDSNYGEPERDWPEATYFVRFRVHRSM